jgi:hypothetical protein
MALPAPTDRPFVGRLAEREALAAHISAAQRGSGRVVLVAGEPGSGKTRLVKEASPALHRVVCCGDGVRSSKGRLRSGRRVRAVACDGPARFVVVVLERTDRARWWGVRL